MLGTYVWANYLRLEHYLLVPVADRWRSARGRPRGRRDRAEPAGAPGRGLGGAPSGRSRSDYHRRPDRAGPRRDARRSQRRGGDRSDDHSGDDFVATVLHALPPNTAILSSGIRPRRCGTDVVLGLRPDVLVVDDTNIVYDGWGTREARVRRSSANVRCSSFDSTHATSRHSRPTTR